MEQILMKGDLETRLKRVLREVKFLEGVGDVAGARRVVRGVYRSYVADEREKVKQEGKAYKNFVKTLHSKRGLECLNRQLKNRLSATPKGRAVVRTSSQALGAEGFPTGSLFYRYPKSIRR
jgi:hypothetical protein